MRRLRAKWRPPLLLVLGGALAGTLALSLTGLVALRYLGPEIGFRHGAIVLALAIGLITAALGLLLVRLLLRPITALADFAGAVRADPGADAPPPAHFGTRELRAMGRSVIDMAETLQNREATIRSYTDHVTHELKTPISVLRAAGELLEDSADLTPPDRALVAQIQSAGVQMQAQLEALRDIAAAREVDYRGHTRLSDLAPDLAAAHRALRIDIEGGALPVPLSRAGLMIVLGHLLDNSAAHGARRVVITAQSGAVTVADDGMGVSPGNRAHVFAPFFTTRRDTGGTGMGLSIVAGLLGAHGARIALAPSDSGAALRMEFS